MDTLAVIRVTALAATILNVVLTILVLSRDFRSTLHRVYLGWGISVTLWNLGVYHLSQDGIGDIEARKWANVLQLGVIFMPVTLFHLCWLIAQARRKWVIPALYLIHIGFAVSLCFGQFISGVQPLDVGYWSIAGLGFYVFSVAYVFITVALVRMLYRKQKEVPPMQRTRLRALLLAIVGLWIFGTNDLMPIMGMENYPLINVKFYPMGSLAAVFYVLIIGYGVLQHRLLDIHVTLSRLAAQIVRLLFMMLVGFLLLLLISRLAPAKSFTPFSFGAAMGVLFVSGLVAGLFFPQFFGRGSDKLERQILGDRFEYHARVQALIQTMRSYPEPQYLLHELQELLVGTMKMRSYQIILLDDTTHAFKLYYSHPAQTDSALPDLQVASPVFRYFQQTRAKFLSCNFYEAERESPLERQAREQLKSFEPEICLPFFVADDLIGMMLLGAKDSGDLFTPHDLRLLVDMSSNLGLLLNQIRLRQQLQVVHEQDLLGRMSRGLAHDLNNLLTPAQTLLQLLQETRLNQATIDELLPMCLRNLETVRTYVNEALFFSRSAKLLGKPGLLDEAVREAIALVKPNAEGKNIQITAEGASDVLIEMDAVLIKRLICNLLSNAIDASPGGARIEVELAPLPKTELNRDWHRLKVIDHGEGINAENLQRVFTPYFTTKNTGDGKRGFGLGLAIARNIVHLHGGNLSITSKEKRGTTVQVDLPSRLGAQTQAAPSPNSRLNMIPT
ncbi:MAG: ATP-binding protein [Limisphaerales bacterium]